MLFLTCVCVGQLSAARLVEHVCSVVFYGAKCTVFHYTLALTLLPGYGISVAGGRDNQHVPVDDGIFISKIAPGGAAEKQGDLAVGDCILEVHASVSSMHVFDIIDAKSRELK